MKIIKMMLGGEEVARITDGQFEAKLINTSPFAFNLKSMYDNCFYGISDTATFEQQFEAAKNGRYFCYSKPSLKLVTEETDDEGSEEE